MTMFRASLFVALAIAPAVHADYKSMDYGPFLNATYQIRTPANNVAYRGTAIGFDVPAGKTIYQAGGGYIFDTEMLRPVAWWTGGSLKLEGVVFSGGHGANPGPDKGTTILLSTKAIPGWAKDGDFKDPREVQHGPLPRDWARFKGLYRSGDKVVFVYTVGATTVMELPEQETVDGVKLLSRTLNLGTTTKAQTFVVFDVPGKGDVAGDAMKFEWKDTIVVDDPAAKTPKDKKMPTKNVEKQLAARVRIQGIDGAKLVVLEGNRLVVNLPPLSAPSKLKVTVWAGERGDQDAGAAALAKVSGPTDLTRLTKGGKSRWEKALVTKGVPADAAKKSNQPQQAYVLDSITPPFQNPYDSWMRIGGFDFFKDGRAAVCTWSGDVWIVSGIDDKLEKIEWKRYAAGLFQALGLKIVDDKVYVLGRDGITRLHDLDGDGEADFYECFNNDFMVTSNFHEFIFDLHTDPAGNFYFIKGGPVRPGGSGWDKIVPHHGCIFKVAKDGSKLEVIARGFRAPNGMGLGPNGEITAGDNQGTWTPVCPINWIKPGGFYGVPEFAGKDPKTAIRDNPLCWLTYNAPDVVDNSNGGQVWITGKKFGPLSGQLLHTSYGQSALYLVMKEEVAGEMQGGVVRLLRFDSGVCRARFVESQNALYLTGLRGWQTNASKDAGFYRVRYTGKPLNLPIDLKVARGKITITFSDPLDTASAASVDSYRIDQWNYRWTSNYGSPQVKTTNAKQSGTEELEIDSVSVGADGKTVTLKIDELKPVMQMRINLTLKAADGTPIRTAIHNTINNVGDLHGEVHVGEFHIVERKR
jgi:glucose/arabinose dehydrogenase